MTNIFHLDRKNTSKPTNIVERQRIGINFKISYFAAFHSLFKGGLDCQSIGICLELVLVNDNNQVGFKFTLTFAGMV